MAFWRGERQFAPKLQLMQQPEFLPLGGADELDRGYINCLNLFYFFRHELSGDNK